MSKLIFSFLLCIFFLSTNAQYSSPKKSAVTRFENGVHAYRMMDFNNAILLFNEAIEKDENFVEPHLVLGDLYTERKELEKAEYHYNRAIEINPKFKPNMFMSAAGVEMKLGKYEEARKHLEAYVQLEELPPPLVEKWQRLELIAIALLGYSNSDLEK